MLTLLTIYIPVFVTFYQYDIYQVKVTELTFTSYKAEHRCTTEPL